MNFHSIYPGEQTRLQQTFFKKVAQSGENYKSRKSRVRSDFDDLRRKSVKYLDSKLRRIADTYLSEPANSITNITDKLKLETGQIANGLREKITIHYKEMLANNEAYKLNVQSSYKEQGLVFKWGKLNIDRLNVSFTKLHSQDVPLTLDMCAAQAYKSRQKIAELGAPSQYGSGQLRRSTIEVMGDVLMGIFYPIKYYFFSLAIPFAMFLGAGFETGCAVAIIAAAILPGIFAGISWGISEAIGASFELVLFFLVGAVFGISALFGGLGLYTSEEEKVSKRKEKIEKRARLLEGYSAYLVLKRAEDLVQGLYENKVKQLEDEKNAGYEDAKMQETAILNTIDRFNAELEKAEHSFQTSMQKLEAEFQQERRELKQEFETILKGLKVYSKLVISGWDTMFRQEDVAQALALNQMNIQMGTGEIRIGSTVFPGSNLPLPMMIDLLHCRHVFIFATQDTDRQATQLLRAIMARLVFTAPVKGVEFVFIDTKAAGTFAEYHNLPQKMGNESYSFDWQIQKQMQSLEQHQKQMQAKVGTGNLQTFNQTAEEPERQHIVGIAGFPNPDRFRTEAQSHLENIILSGARVGIHVVLKISFDSAAVASRPIDQTLFFKNGVVLRPSKSLGQWDVCFNGQVFPFVPDQAPEEATVINLIPQIHKLYKSEPEPDDRPMRVFLCYAFEDKSLVREVYEKLKEENWIDPWLSEEGLLPGQEWELEIEKKMENADAAILFLSNISVQEPGFLHREIRKVLDIADEKPEGNIFIIPVRLDECELPNRRLKKLHWLDYFPNEQHNEKYQQLYRALRTEYDKTRKSL